MKRLIPILIVLLCGACQSNGIDLSECSDKPTRAAGFVYTEDDRFALDGVEWFPMVLNYKVDWRVIDDTAVVSPAFYYDNPDAWDANTAAGTLEQFRRHARLATEAGFNSLRICMDVTNSDGHHRFYGSSERPLFLVRDSAAIYGAIDRMATIAEEEGLRLILLITKELDEEFTTFARGLLRHCADNPTVWAYDFFNEPLYFDPVEQRSKESAYRQVAEWHRMMRQLAPHQLFTVALSEPIEVFEWDASILPVDFVEMHTYHPLRVAAEMYWYSQFCRARRADRPWMVGETGLPADNDSVPYTLQCQFFEETFGTAVGYGAAGYGWWEFQDNPRGPNFEAQHTGLYHWDGNTLVAKPIVEHTRAMSARLYELGLAGPDALRDSTLTPETRSALESEWEYYLEGCRMTPEPPTNYYNMLAYSNIVLEGQVESSDGPVEGAVVRGWNDDWSVGVNTYTDSEGRFALYSNDYCVHFEVSAPGMSHLKFNRSVTYQPVLQELPNREREYQQIDYRPYLTGDSAILTFRNDAFGQWQTRGDMGTLKLKKITK